MGLAIIDNALGDRAFRLRNAIMARRFYLPEEDLDAVGGSVGTNWTKILIGISCAFRINTTLIGHGDSIGEGHFGFGIQSGNTINDCFGLGGKHAIGVFIPSVGNSPMTYKSDTTPPIVYDWFTNRVYRFRNGADDNLAFPSNSQLNISADPDTSRSFYLIQAEKNSGNLVFSIGHLINQVNLPQVDFDKTALTTMIENLTDISDVNTYAPSGKWAYNQVTFTGSDTEQATYGYFDTVFISWTGNSENAVFEVYDIRYRVLS